MNKQISFKQYRTIDLCIFTAITVFSEALVTIAARQWFPNEPYALSLVTLFSCLVMMRWGAFAVIPAVVCGIIGCYLADATFPQYVVYCAGNSFSLLSLIFLKLLKKERVRSNVIYVIFYTIITYVFIQLGRGIVSVFFGDGISSVVAYLTTEIVSLLFACIALIIIRNADGVFEDQKSYLLRLDEEKKEKQAEIDSENYYGPQP